MNNHVSIRQVDRAGVTKLEKRLKDVYKQAEKELDGKARNYFKQFSRRDTKEYAAYQAGKYTKKEFEAWLINQYGRGQRWEDSVKTWRGG